jgi:hypothetical protein
VRAAQRHDADHVGVDQRGAQLFREHHQIVVDRGPGYERLGRGAARPERRDAVERQRTGGDLAAVAQQQRGAAQVHAVVQLGDREAGAGIEPELGESVRRTAAAATSDQPAAQHQTIDRRAARCQVPAPRPDSPRRRPASPGAAPARRPGNERGSVEHRARGGEAADRRPRRPAGHLGNARQRQQQRRAEHDWHDAQQLAVLLPAARRVQREDDQ